MELNFIGQGLNPGNDVTVGNQIISSLNSDEYNFFGAFVAFISVGGIKNIISHLINFRDKGNTVRIYLGVDLHATSTEALEKLLEHSIESYIIYSPNNIIYHPKVYIFRGDNNNRMIIGSSNFTVGGLFQNAEASICIDFNANEEENIQILSGVFEYYEKAMDLTHQSCQQLTPDILQLLIDNKVVFSEATNREKSNKINREYGTKNLWKNKDFLNYFGKTQANRPPEGYNKIINKEEMFIEGDENVNIADETVELPPGSLWIETQKMTGGSKNILDLSKSGRLDGVKKFGSVEYFGVDPNDTNFQKTINIHLGGKAYEGNPIFFAPANQNWRIQLRGVTDNGERLTTISKPQKGYAGGFIDKILLFTRIDDDNFKLEILDYDNKENLIENSYIWATSGSTKTGRAYGII